MLMPSIFGENLLDDFFGEPFGGYDYSESGLMTTDVKDTDKVIEEIHEEAKTEEKENDKGEKEIVEVSPAKDKVKIVKRPVPLNDTNPLWTKNPSECTDEDYKEFYRKVFMDYMVKKSFSHFRGLMGL